MANSTTDSLATLLEHFDRVRPIIPTYLILIASSILPIYTGAHASLHRPVSAAKPAKRDKDGDAALTTGTEEETDMKQGFEWLDVLLYPLLAAALLTGLYWVITNLDDMLAVITNVLNAYMSVFGLVGLFAFLSDGLGSILSYVFPSKYRDQDRVWVVDEQRHVTLPVRKNLADKHPGMRYSPWPPALRVLCIPPAWLWWMRDLIARPAFVVEAQIFGLKTHIRPTALKIFCAGVATAAVLYFNLVDRAWWLTSVLGLSFTYSAFQLMSPTSFQIGSVLLTALLFYDIYMVFFTPMMITVATKLDIPAKIMIPNPKIEGRKGYSMLGLGDIVIPGMVMTMALRFDLYLYYLKKQKILSSSSVHDEANDAPRTEADSGRTDATTSSGSKRLDSVVKSKTENTAIGGPKPSAVGTKRYIKAPYQKVTGSWGDRFWLGKDSEHFVGGNFPKVYFWASMVGYLSGLLVTLAIVQIYDHGQPALLYLVPGVLISLWTTAAVRGEARVMWKYTEDPDQGRAGGIDSAAILNSDASLEQFMDLAPVESEIKINETVPSSEDSTSETNASEDSGEIVDAEDGEERNDGGESVLIVEEKQPAAVPKQKTEHGPKMTSKEEETVSRAPANSTKEGSSSADQDRCLFKLIISLPPLPSNEEQEAPQAQGLLTDADQSTVDWEAGTPFAKRRRLGD